MFARWLIAIGLSLSLFATALGSTTARQETSTLATAAAHQLLVQAADDHFINPSVVAPGLTYITYENIGQESRHTFFARLPGDRTLDELLAGPENPDLPPDWLFDSHFPGFAAETEPGETSTALVNLEPGLYVLLDDFSGVILVDPALASEATPVANDLVADATVDMHDFGYTLPESIAAGPQIWEMTNSGPQVHELMLLKSDVADVTLEQVLAAFASETGEADGFSMEDIAVAGGLSWMSPGATAWIELDLEPGTYIAVCWVFDMEAMMPHAMEGMVQIFTVE